ncbi:integrase catalytic domain-containing protein [Trichonephila clavipes]|nr:integrase catalytic domain-containing protein [Trichonephila clavipes]
MSYHKNTRKEDLINVLKEIGEQATSKETIMQLKTKLEKSAAFKDDPDFVINLLNLSVEDRQVKAERQLQETNSQLELEKIKLQQIEREIELQKTLAEGQVTQQSSKGDTNNLENLIKSVKTLTIQIPTKTENFGLFFQSLERSFRVKNVPENLKAEILINILGGEDDVELTGGVANSRKIADGSNLFLLKVSETFVECLYDVSHISNSGIRDKSRG